MKEENLDIFVIDHIGHFGKEPHYTDDNKYELDLCDKLVKDLQRTIIRKEKIKRILCQD